MPDIVLQLPGKPDTEISLIPGAYRVGSSPASHIMIRDKSVQPRHCRLEVSGQGIHVFDLCGGTLLNGDPVGTAGAVLKPGDVLKLGDAEFLVPGKKIESVPVPSVRKNPVPPAPVPKTAFPDKREGKIPVLEISGILPHQPKFLHCKKQFCSGSILSYH